MFLVLEFLEELFHLFLEVLEVLFLVLEFLEELFLVLEVLDVPFAVHEILEELFLVLEELLLACEVLVADLVLGLVIFQDLD